MITKIISITLVFFPSAVFACATCFGAPDDPATNGMNWAIITLLGVTGGVLAAVGSAIVKLKNKARNYSSETESDDAENKS